MSFRSKGTVATTVVVSRLPDGSGNFRCDGIDDHTEINLALAHANAIGAGEVLLLQGTYNIADPIIFPANNLILRGVGRATVIDGDLLSTDEHGIEISGRTDCVIRDLAIQTEDGGTKTCHCIFIEDGSHRFTIEKIWILASDADGIHIEGESMAYGRIWDCDITGCDGDGINGSMDAGNYLDYINIQHNSIRINGGDGIEFANRVRYSRVRNNQINGNTGYGINISGATSTANIIQDNELDTNTTGAINDIGTDTQVHHEWEKPTNPDSNIGDHPAMQMLDNVDTYIRNQIYIPLEFQELVTAQIVVVQVTAANPNMVWTCSTDWGKICSAEDYLAGSDDTGATSALAQDDLVCLDFSGALVGIAPGDLIGVSFMRDGDDGADNVGGPVYYLGIRIRYV